MGNRQSNICSGPTPEETGLDALVLPTEAELETYVTDVKVGVENALESFEARKDRYVQSFAIDAEKLRAITASFVEELQIGLSCHKAHPFEHRLDECSFKMLDSFVPRAPKGNENGVFYALDFGGSNFRVVRVAMENGKIRTTHKKASLADCETNLPKGLLDSKASATMMFDFFATIVESFMKESGDYQSRSPFPLGFTFSFPCIARKVDSASLLVWTKGFETARMTDDPVEGKDVAELMNRALIRKSIPLKVNCVANDTVGTLLSCAYNVPAGKPQCGVGLILGTGMNACYIEERAGEYAYVGNIINIECGNFNRDTLPRTNIDHELDFEDVGGRGRQHLEKMVSGAYLGDLCRRMLVKLFQYKAPTLMWQAGTLSSEDAATICADKSTSNVVSARKVMERWNATMKPEELAVVKSVCQAVYNRAAALSAMIIAGCAIKTGKLQLAMGGVTVGIDGSLYKCNAFFREAINKYLRDILGDRQASLVHLMNADDGSGLGAAILSAVVSSD